MFICKGCAAPEFKSMFDWSFLSRGPCENCGYTDVCVDSKIVDIDPKWKENLWRDLLRTGLIPADTPLSEVKRAGR